jgi:tetratricopeptide (TPR) repeat protein
MEAKLETPSGKDALRVSQAAEPPADKHSIEYAVWLMFTNKINEAQEMCVDSADYDSRRALLYALCAFLNGMASFGDGVLDDALVRIWKADEVGKNEGTLSGATIRAEAYFLGSLVQLVTEQYLKGMWNMRSSWNMFDKVKKDLEEYDGEDKVEIQSCYDMYVGFFNIILSLLPPFIVSIAEYIGFSGNRQLGLDMVQAAFDSKSVYAPVAALFLLVYYCNISEQIGDYNPKYEEESVKLLKWADTYYPKSVFFAILAVRYFRSKGDMKLAIEVADEATLLSQDLPGFGLMFGYNSGWCAWMMQDYEAHLKYFLALFKGSDNKMKNNFEAVYAVMCGFSYAIVGKEKECLEIMGKVPSLQKARMRTFDHWVKRKASKYVDSDGSRCADSFLDQCEMIALFGAWGHMNDEHLTMFTEKLEKLRAEREIHWDVDDQVLYKVIKAYLAFNSEKFDEALELVEQIRDFESELSKSAQKDGLMVHAYYVQGRVYDAKNQLEDALAAIQNGESYSGYDTSRFIGFRLYALKQIVKARIE